jgi:PAN domain
MGGIVLRACAFAFALSTAAVTAPPSAPPPVAPAPPPVAGLWEPNTDRPGADYRRFELGAPRPEVCRDACWGEPQCRAFTYARPGALGPRALCYLKNAVPPSRPADCCLSGVK